MKVFDYTTIKNSSALLLTREQAQAIRLLTGVIAPTTIPATILDAGTLQARRFKYCKQRQEVLPDGSLGQVQTTDVWEEVIEPKPLRLRLSDGKKCSLDWEDLNTFVFDEKEQKSFEEKATALKSKKNTKAIEKVLASLSEEQLSKLLNFLQQ